jgi:protein-L-isoaspartate(D-aspartate) O-methyltransferase
MCEYLDLTEENRVLEIGTGSGYQTAILAECAGEVVTVEIVEVLYRRARRLLSRLGYDNVECRMGDGSAGAADRGPFDAIVISAAAPRFPAILADQLGDSGRMIYPHGDPHGFQELVYVKKAGKRLEKKTLLPVRFVPMTGRIGR